MDQLEAMRIELDALKLKVEDLEKAAFSGDDYRQINNAIMGHIHSYYAHTERLDLEKFWVESRDDIVYAHNDRAYFGKQGVWEYYIDGTDRNKARYSKYAKEIYNIDVPQGAAAGYRVIHVLGSPYVEIAEDRKTAQGIWMSFSFMSSMDSEGYANPSYILQRFSGEFLNENGTWKLWHVRDYTDVSMDIKTNVSGPDEAERDESGKPIERGGPPLGSDKKGMGPVGPGRPDDCDGKKIRNLILESSSIYQPWTCSVSEPKIPDAYSKWDPSQTYIKFVDEHKDENSSFNIK